ncbi:MAG: RagB/SusD family nutrient uptake outer membrane protein, partial [Bacteroidetes bacterium]|nr:RagB/SusD family nutrient uptake outer membrane protein [Bacteroidota bacterium]
MKKILSYIILAAGVVFAGCEEDLDIPNPNEPTIDLFWSNAQDAEQGVNAIYSTSHRGGFSRWMPMLYISRSDEGYSGSPWSDLANALDRFIQPDYNFGPVSDVWVDLYVGIFRANQVIANVPDIDMDDALKQRLLGEAYFLRGQFYYHLVSLWGNVPLMLDPSTPTDQPATASQAEVWAQVVEDLTLASNALPAVYPDARDLGRATEGAAKALLAKAYMQQQNYQAALEPLQWLVEGEGAGIYGLMPN